MIDINNIADAAEKAERLQNLRKAKAALHEIREATDVAYALTAIGGGNQISIPLEDPDMQKLAGDLCEDGIKDIERRLQNELTELGVAGAVTQ